MSDSEESLNSVEIEPIVQFALKPFAGNEKFLGCIHLNSPKTFNALNLEMVELIQAQLDLWEHDKSVLAIWLDGEGEKAFCSGGDVKGLFNGRIDAEGAVQNTSNTSASISNRVITNPSAVNFFDKEYTLDLKIHTYSKPILCWGHGVVMGGGIGLMAGCTHRIVTEKSRSAMPEITIGLFPDVGGSWFLNRMPGRIGLFLGLTGASINAHDAIFSGLANRFINHDKKSSVLEAIQNLDEQAFVEGGVTKVLKAFESESEGLPKSELQANFELIQKLTDAEALGDIVEMIVGGCAKSENDWLKRAGETLTAGCPRTAHLVYQQLKRGRYMSLTEVFEMERKISAQCMAQPDFYEGVRALLIDKDKRPQWSEQNVRALNSADINHYF